MSVKRGKSVGRQVFGWRWPVVWWARRKPQSRFRQGVWWFVDLIHWRYTVLPMIRAARRRS